MRCGRGRYSDTHCTTPGYTGSYRPIVLPSQRPARLRGALKAAAVGLLVTLGVVAALAVVAYASRIVAGVVA